jgi:hypothetical protein
MITARLLLRAFFNTSLYFSPRLSSQLPKRLVARTILPAESGLIAMELSLNIRDDINGMMVNATIKEQKMAKDMVSAIGFKNNGSQSFHENDWNKYRNYGSR